MSQRDKTGPEGEGPKTGRGLGSCSEEKENSEKTLEKSE